MAATQTQKDYPAKTLKDYSAESQKKEKDHHSVSSKERPKERQQQLLQTNAKEMELMSKGVRRQDLKEAQRVARAEKKHEE